MILKKLLSGVALACLVSGASAANLVTNGDFETFSFAGWVTAGNPVSSTVTQPYFSTSAVWVDSNSTSFTTISQTLSTVTGATYDLSFEFMANGTPNELKVWFGNQVAFTQTDYNYEVGTGYTVTGLVASSANTVLTFGSRNNSGSNVIDNISVTAVTAPVPEPETYAMLLAGLGLIGSMARRRKQKSAA